MTPGNADGSLDGIALKPLTVAFHEPGFIATLQAENQQPFWFMMSGEQKQQTGNPMGPANPQALNRYTYVLNSPLRWTDPSGHWTFAISFSGIGFFGSAGGRASVSIAFDDKGNFAVMSGIGGGSSTGVGGGLGPGVAVTNAQTVYDLEGDSVQGGFVGGQRVGASVEGVVGKDRRGERVYGVAISLEGVVAYTPPGFPAVVYVTGERDSILYSTRDLKRMFYDAGMCYEMCEDENGGVP